ncbi:Molybdopterin-synthase adenylyltransferase [Candidatus Magnetaquicoccaceae bacterium FCR-1]|uniref:Molybdopterin-synthase adenylyltransferase n=1 Tax=Candidatus Magnetaquiglobus chichijimensis TaxID=3141448 RepID=A0ABQ0CDG3_9PROT
MIPLDARPFATQAEPDTRLQSATVFILGAGGLGCPLALLLARARIGHLIIADDDRVALSNLPRQILHVTSRLGQPKVLSAHRALQSVASETRVTPIPERVTPENIHALLESCDLAVDGSDNFASRHLLNRACLAMGIPYVSGAVLGFEGQVGVFLPGVDPYAPCYACLHPEPETGCGMDPVVPTCATAGVLGPIAGQIAALQAKMVVELLTLGVESVRAGGLWLINPLDHLFMRVAIPKDPGCRVCGGWRGMTD